MRAARASRMEKLLDGCSVRIYRDEEYEKEYIIYFDDGSDSSLYNGLYQGIEIVKCFDRYESDAIVDAILFLSPEEYDVDRIRRMSKSIKKLFRRYKDQDMTIAQAQGKAVVESLYDIR